MPAAGLDWMWLRAVARGLHMAASFGVFGTMLLTVLLVPPEAPALHRVLRRLAWGSLGVALAAGLAWFALQTADMAGAESLGDLWPALPAVAQTTRFGQLLIGRCRLALGVGRYGIWCTGAGENSISGLARGAGGAESPALGAGAWRAV
jgi:hypothetical protein